MRTLRSGQSGTSPKRSELTLPLFGEWSGSSPQGSVISPSPALSTVERSGTSPEWPAASPSTVLATSERSVQSPQRSGLTPSLVGSNPPSTMERPAQSPQRSALPPSITDFATSERSAFSLKRSEPTPTLVAIDGGNDTWKPVYLVRCLVENPQLKFSRAEKRTPKRNQLSKKKNGDQKYVYQTSTPEEWEFTTGLIYDLIPTLPPNTIVRCEPDIGSYRKDRDKIIRLMRQYGVTLQFCDSKLSARQRIKYGIPKDEKCDFTDAILIYLGIKDSFGAAKLMSEKKAPLDRKAVKKVLEVSEESGWTNQIAKEALAFISSEDISARFGPDLAQPVFIVTAYVAARDPQCVNRNEFDRFCGLFARARSRGNRGIGSVISSNLSHFNENPLNRTAARYIFHKVKAAVAT